LPLRCCGPECVPRFDQWPWPCRLLALPPAGVLIVAHLPGRRGELSAPGLARTLRPQHRHQVGDKGVVVIFGPDGWVAAEFGQARVWLSRDEYEPCH
jgi:hypothetical protein